MNHDLSTAGIGAFFFDMDGVIYRGSGYDRSIIRSTAVMGNLHEIFRLSGQRQGVEDLGFDYTGAAISQKAVQK